MAKKVKIILQTAPYRVCQIIEVETGKKLDEYAAHRTCEFICKSNNWEIVE